MLLIKQIPVLNDNYLFMIYDQNTRTSGCVDPAVSEPLINELEKENLGLDFILNTHHHFDHVGANLDLKKKYGCKIVGSQKDSKRIPGIDIMLGEGDIFKFGRSTCRVLEVSGHTNGHIAFYFKEDNCIFCGDTLFSLGCGRLFEGSPKQMVESLSKIRSLPDHTKIYCAHEYTLNNAEFALSIDPKNGVLKRKVSEIKEKRSQNIATVPALLSEEKELNPFLNFDNKEFIKRIGIEDISSTDNFRVIREMKDKF